MSAKVRSGPLLDLEDDYRFVFGPGLCRFVLPGIPVMDKGRFDRAYGFASRPTMLADVRLP